VKKNEMDEVFKGLQGGEHRQFESMVGHKKGRTKKVQAEDML
jgi:hypothetical protein